MSSQSNKSLVDGLSVLSYLAGSREPVGCREMARRLGMDTTRVNRLLMTLKELGLAKQDEKRKYLPGSGIHVLAAQCIYGSKLLNRAIRVLGEVRDVGYLVALGVLWRDSVSYLIHSELSKGVSNGVGGGPGAYPAVSSVIGRLLLAYKDDSYIDQFCSENYAGDLLALKKELVEIRHFGYSLLKQENCLSLAVPLTKTAEAGLSFSNIPLDADIPKVVGELQTLAARIIDN